jgi:hypothetical protein
MHFDRQPRPDGLAIEHAKNCSRIGLSVLLDLFGRAGAASCCDRSGLHHSRVVADNEHDLMAEIPELAELLRPTVWPR